MPTACSLQPAFEYHPSGWRLQKAGASWATYLYGPGGQLLSALEGSVGYTDYVYFAGRLLFTMSEGSFDPRLTKLTRVYSDRLGSTRATWVATYGGGSTTRNYYPFGEEIGGPLQGDANQYKYASTYRDSTTGLDYAVNRYYASGTGRFLSVDRGPANLGDPQSLNRYPYAGSDPANNTDPTGLFYGPPTGPTYTFNPYPDPSSSLPSAGGGGDGSGMVVVAGDPDGGEVTGGGVDCSSLAAQALPGMTTEIAERVASLAPGNPGLQALIAFTWSAESGFSYYPQNYVNGKDKAAAIEEGNVDIGPMQINYRTWIGEVSRQYNADPEGLISPGNVFGTNTGAGAFNGIPEANLQFGAQILSGLYKKYGDAAAGYYRAGEGTWVQTPAGQAAYSKRQSAYDASKDKLKSFFASSCNRF